MKTTVKKYAIGLLVSSLLVPAISYAALDGIKTLVSDFGSIVNLVYPIVFTLALVFFMWGMAQYILKSSDPKAREDGKSRMFWGVIAVFVLISIYGIVWFIGNLFGIPTGINPNNPSANTPGGSYDPCLSDPSQC